MQLSRRKFTQEFKLTAVRQMEEGVRTMELARVLEVDRRTLNRWREQFRKRPGNPFPGHGKRRWPESQTVQMERKIAQQALEIDFLKGCLQSIEEERLLQALTGKPRSARRSRKI